MAYSPHDVFPGALPSRTLDLALLVEALDASRDVVANYSFGAGSPDVIRLGEREILAASMTGAISPRTVSHTEASRLFVEYEPPYGVDP